MIGALHIKQIWLWCIDVEITPFTFDNFHGHE